jgi:hypothetical protein
VQKRAAHPDDFHPEDAIVSELLHVRLRNYIIAKRGREGHEVIIGAVTLVNPDSRLLILAGHDVSDRKSTVAVVFPVNVLEHVEYRLRDGELVLQEGVAASGYLVALTPFLR